jgi:hypothetical protein
MIYSKLSGYVLSLLSVTNILRKGFLWATLLLTPPFLAPHKRLYFIYYTCSFMICWCLLMLMI